jgi:hypothetical protein
MSLEQKVRSPLDPVSSNVWFGKDATVITRYLKLKKSSEIIHLLSIWEIKKAREP